MRPSLSRSRRAKPRFPGGWCLGAALLYVLLYARGVAGQTPDSTGAVTSVEECCKELLLPLGGRIVALGRAVVADTAPDAALYNPAGLVGLHHAELMVHYRKLIADVQMLGLSFVTAPRKFGTFALSYTLVDEGSIPITGTDPNAPELGLTFSQIHELGATFATAVGAGVSAGITYRVFVANTPCTGCVTGGASGATQLIDLGVQYHPRRLPGLSFGAALVNAGLPLQIVNYEQSDRPPVRERVGATFEFLRLVQHDSTLTGTVSAQVDAGGDDGVVPAVGAQVTVGDVVSIRGGWRSAGNSPIGSIDSGATLGVGLKLQRFTVSVARALVPAAGDSDSPFQITFGMSF